MILYHGINIGKTAGLVVLMLQRILKGKARDNVYTIPIYGIGKFKF